MKFLIISVICIALACRSVDAQCVTPSPTTVSGTHAPQGYICHMDVIFEDDFNYLDRSKWGHEITMAGGGNGEFQWYTDSERNSFVRDGALYIKPTLTSDIYGEDFILWGHVDLGPACTNNDNNGCERQANPDWIIPPTQSARLRTLQSFSFKFGRVDIRAKIPSGDWKWPALWFLPTYWVYGGWPMSGEIDLMESRGNRNLYDDQGHNVGVEEFGSTLHFGTNTGNSAWWSSNFLRRSPAGQGFNQGFHQYQLEWASSHISWSIDGQWFGTVPVGEGFFVRGQFTGWNPWEHGTLMAPFDQEFHLLMNVAVGGNNGFFPPGGNQGGKPWENGYWRAMSQFWEGRAQWIPTWNQNDDWDSSMVIDYVRIYAL